MVNYLQNSTFRVKLLVVLLAGISLSARGMAADLYAMSLAELLNVEVTGSTLTPQSYKSVPSSVTVFHHTQISSMGVDTLDELMNLVPGFQSYRSSTTPLDYPFSSRGRRIGTASAEILVLLDGQRLNDARTSGSAITTPGFSLAQVERIEFIRGPGASIYGSNAMMGVVNIISRTEANEFSLGAGSFNRRKASLLTSTRQEDFSFDFFAHIDSDDGDNFLAKESFGESYIETDDPRKFADLNLKVGWRDTKLNIQHNQNKAENFFSFNGASNGISYRESRLSSISARQNFVWRNVSSYIRLGYSSSSFNVISQATPAGSLEDISSPPSEDPIITKSALDDISEARILFANDWKINALSSIQFGLEHRKLDVPELITRYNYDINAYINNDFPVTFYNGFGSSRTTQGASTRDITGTYGQYQRSVSDSTDLTLGLRYDDFSNIGSQLSPRLALVKSLSENHSLKLLFGEAFRAPSEEEFNLAPSASFAGNEQLKAETVQTLELIWSAQWTQTRFSFGYFHNHFEDAIVLALTDTNMFSYRNVNGENNSEGLEFELSHELSRSWALRVSHTYIIEKPAESFRETDHLSSIGIHYQNKAWQANLNAVAHGERDMLTPQGSQQTLDAYWQIYAKLRYTINAEWQTSLQIKNLLNEDYVTPSSSSLLTEGIPNRGREVLLGLTWNFQVSD